MQNADIKDILKNWNNHMKAMVVLPGCGGSSTKPRASSGNFPEYAYTWSSKIIAEKKEKTELKNNLKWLTTFYDLFWGLLVSQT